MRWQKDYHDIPNDDLVIEPIEPHQKLFPESKYVHLIGPHNKNPINLMIAGRKPVAMLYHEDMPNWYRHIAEHNWDVTYHVSPKGSTRIFVSLPGMMYRVNKLIETLDRDFPKGPTYIRQIKIGYLLGYKKANILAFILHSQHNRRCSEKYRKGTDDEFTYKDVVVGGDITVVKKGWKVATPADSTIRLEVGKSYLNRRRRTEIIIGQHTDTNGDLRFTSKESIALGRSYFEFGGIDKNRATHDDLFKLIDSV